MKTNNQYLDDLHNLTDHIVNTSDLETLKSFAGTLLRVRYAGDDVLFEAALREWKNGEKISVHKQELILKMQNLKMAT